MCVRGGTAPRVGAGALEVGDEDHVLGRDEGVVLRGRGEGPEDGPRAPPHPADDGGGGAVPVVVDGFAAGEPLERGEALDRVLGREGFVLVGVELGHDDGGEGLFEVERRLGVFGLELLAVPCW